MNYYFKEKSKHTGEGKHQYRNVTVTTVCTQNSLYFLTLSTCEYIHTLSPLEHNIIHSNAPTHQC